MCTRSLSGKQSRARMHFLKAATDTMMRFNKLLPISTASTDAIHRVRTLRDMMNQALRHNKDLSYKIM